MTYQGQIDSDFIEHRARMQQACTDALDEIDKKLRYYDKTGVLKLWQMNDQKRLKIIRKEINETLNDLQLLINPEVIDSIESAYETGYIWNACTVENTIMTVGGKIHSASAFSFGGVDKKLLYQSVNQKIAGLTVSDRLSAERLGLLWHERDAVAKSKLLGYGEAKTARQVILADVQEGVSSSFSRACMIARTESTRNATQATNDSNDEAADYGIDTRLKWISGKSTIHPHSPPHSTYNGRVAGQWSEEYGMYVFIINGMISRGPGLCAHTKDNFGCRCSTGTICIGYAEFYPSASDIAKYREKYAAV